MSNQLAKVTPHCEALEDAADAMDAAGIGGHPKLGYPVVLRDMASSLRSEAARGKVSYSFDSIGAAAADDGSPAAAQRQEEDVRLRAVRMACTGELIRIGIDPRSIQTEKRSNISKSGLNGDAESSSAENENPPNLKMFEREDWTLFRTVEGLQQKAGVPATLLRRLVLKELADNALDVGDVIFSDEDDVGIAAIEDAGPGLDGTPEEIAELFSIRRPMRSTKLLRLPQRGALGNGLRVVAGAVLASEGSLAIVTRNRRIELCPKADGSTAVVSVTEADRPVGTRIEIGFGAALPFDHDMFTWALNAKRMASHGDSYGGRSSPFWFDAAAFHEALLSCGSQPVRSLLAQFDGCTGGKAGEIVAAAGLDRMACKDIDRHQATRLLETARLQTRPVSPERLGYVGRDAFPDQQYAMERGTAAMGSSEPQAKIPFVVEVWAQKAVAGDRIGITCLINRTPSVSPMNAWRDGDKDLCISGSGLRNYTRDAPKKGAYDIRVNVTTPYCPITSDGKAPDLQPFLDEIMTAIATAMRKAQRAAPKDKKVSQKDVVLDHLDEVIAAVSGDGQYRFSERQLFYRLRPFVQEETGQELKIENFTAIITDYEDENGEIEGMFRDACGSIYHPHRGETIVLSTINVENYERPVWTFHKLCYIEKEGFTEALKDDGWAERHDCALASTKGFTTRAIRDLVDQLAEHDEPVDVYCVTDADAFGTIIYQTFQEATKARGARKIRIVHLGLEPWEAIEMGLEVENVGPSKKRKPVADYVLEREDRAPNGDTWEEWLQTHRVELNAMTTPEFMAWLSSKIGNDKLLPPADVVKAEYGAMLESRVRAAVTERILCEAGIEEQIADALATIERPSSDALVKGIKRMFKRDPEREWRDHVRLAAMKAKAAA